ncbi:MAG: response regulator transcription factor [Hespellia sp.]|nr:response regulator transcription factor [Hespellia sp.]
MNTIEDAKILIVDDNPGLRRLVTGILKRDGFCNLTAADCCAAAKSSFLQCHPDFIILDIMLPDGDGFSLMPFFRKSSFVPVLFLSAKDEDEDRLRGLGLGADDYLTKPFLPQELLLRIRSILRRTYQIGNAETSSPSLLTLGTRTIDFAGAVVTEQNGTASPLTAKELLLLQKLYENRGNIVTFDAICETLWGDAYYGYENSLMVHIRRLREKVEEIPSKPKWILTARGLGYKLAKERL